MRPLLITSQGNRCYNCMLFLTVKCSRLAVSEMSHLCQGYDRVKHWKPEWYSDALTTIIKYICIQILSVPHFDNQQAKISGENIK